jgi:hypothetical protein
MHLCRRLGFILASLILSIACGGGSGSTTSPAPPAPGLTWPPQALVLDETQATPRVIAMNEDGTVPTVLVANAQGTQFDAALGDWMVYLEAPLSTRTWWSVRKDGSAPVKLAQYDSSTGLGGQIVGYLGGRAVVLERLGPNQYEVHSLLPDGTGKAVLGAHAYGEVRGGKVLLTVDTDTAGVYDLSLINADGTGKVRLKAGVGGSDYARPIAGGAQWVISVFKASAFLTPVLDLYAVKSDGTGSVLVAQDSRQFGSMQPPSFGPAEPPMPWIVEGNRWIGTVVTASGQILRSVNLDGTGAVDLDTVPGTDDGLQAWVGSGGKVIYGRQIAGTIGTSKVVPTIGGTAVDLGATGFQGMVGTAALFFDGGHATGNLWIKNLDGTGAMVSSVNPAASSSGAPYYGAPASIFGNRIYFRRTIGATDSILSVLTDGTGLLQHDQLTGNAMLVGAVGNRLVLSHSAGQGDLVSIATDGTTGTPANLATQAVPETFAGTTPGRVLFNRYPTGSSYEYWSILPDGTSAIQLSAKGSSYR